MEAKKLPIENPTPVEKDGILRDNMSNLEDELGEDLNDLDREIIKELSEEPNDTFQKTSPLDEVDTSNVMSMYKLSKERKRQVTEEIKQATTVPELLIHTNPDHDSEVMKVEFAIIEAANTDEKVLSIASSPKAADPYEVIRISNQVHDELANEQWLDFVKKYPEKAEAYAAAGHEGISDALTWNNRSNEDDQFYVGKAEQRIYKNPAEDPIIKRFEDQVQIETNTHSATESAAKEFEVAREFTKIRNSVEAQVANEVWGHFVTKYPEKSLRYADLGHTGILKALEAKDAAANEPETIEETVQIEKMPTVEELKEPEYPAQTYARSAEEQADIQLPSHEEQKEAQLHNEYVKILKIDYKEIESVEGFSELSSGQKRMVLENLKHCTYENLQTEATRLYQESAQAENKKQRETFRNFFGGKEDAKSVKDRLIGKTSTLLAGAVSSFNDAFKKESRLAEHQADAFKNMKGDADNTRIELFTQLVDSMSTNGPEVYETSSGELVVDLINLREQANDSTIESNEWSAMQELNKAADEFARIPIEWRGQTLGTETNAMGSFFNKHFGSEATKQTQRYTASQMKYEQARTDLELRLRAGGKTDVEITKTLFEIDIRVNQLQTLRTNPQALYELANIEEIDPDKVALKSLFKNSRIGYMALGSVARTVLGQSLGFVTAPAVAFATASVKSWNQSAAELRERDRHARRGVKDTKSGSLNVDSSTNLTRKLSQLIIRCQNAKGTDTEKTLASLRSRVEYTHDKLMLNRVNYGEQKTMVSSQTTLAKTLGEALTFLSMEEMSEDEIVTERKKQTDERLEAKLDRTEVSIKKNRKTERRVKAVSSGATASLAAFGGAYVADFIIDHINGTVDVATSMIAETPPSVDPNIIEAEPIISEPDVLPDTEEIIPNLPTVADDELPITFEEPTFSPPGEVTPEVEQFGTYQIRTGDTMTNLLKEGVPLMAHLDPDIQENVIANVLNSLSPEEMEAIGFSGDNIDLIYEGQEINLDVLHEVVESKRHFIDQALERITDNP